MMRNGGLLKNSKKPAQENFNHTLKLIHQLNDALKNESLAIEELDDQKLQDYGDRIEKLLNDLETHLPDKKELPAEQSKKLSHLLKGIKGFREKNRRRLEEALKTSGNTINRLARGRQTLKAYKGIKQGHQELFLKKRC